MICRECRCEYEKRVANNDGAMICPDCHDQAMVDHLENIKILNADLKQSYDKYANKIVYTDKG